MGKRFTETRKWETPAYRGLSMAAKVVLQYVEDRCDNAGVWEPDFAMAQFCIGAEVIDFGRVHAELGDRVRVLKNGKWWLTRFIQFQCGQLKPETCHPHRTVVRLLQQHGISPKDPWITGDTAAEEGTGAEPAPNEPYRMIEPHSEVIQQLAIAQGIEMSRITLREKDKLAKAAKMILDAEPGATGAQVAGAGLAYRKKYKEAPMTALAIAGHWSELAPARRSQEEVDEEFQVQITLAELKRKLSDYMHKPFGMLIARPDLTEDQLVEARQLSERIDELQGQL